MEYVPMHCARSDVRLRKLDANVTVEDSVKLLSEVEQYAEYRLGDYQDIDDADISIALVEMCYPAFDCMSDDNWQDFEDEYGQGIASAFRYGGATQQENGRWVADRLIAMDLLRDMGLAVGQQMLNRFVNRVCETFNDLERARAQNVLSVNRHNKAVKALILNALCRIREAFERKTRDLLTALVADRREHPSHRRRRERSMAILSRFSACS